MKRLWLGVAVLLVAVVAVVYFVMDRPGHRALLRLPFQTLLLLSRRLLRSHISGWRRSSFSHKKAQKSQS